jgi:uroporphyrinogen III methyltransferase/synthase
MKKRGKVYLVGAGPGDVGLITVRGLECIRAADLIAYDHLVNAELLRHAKPDAKLVFVGKTPKKHTVPQEKLNALLVKWARAGKIVTRLKGGDPFVFGRGGEEAEELARARVDFEIVPGITSAIAAPAYAGIPITHRAFASGVAFITGHEDPTKPESALNWQRVAQFPGTKVILMGVERISEIARALVRGGCAPKTPVAMVRWGTTNRQETICGTLGTIADIAARKNFQAPAVTIVGDVVKMREKLNWFERKPLFGRRIVVTRARHQASILSEKLRALGAEVIEIPTIRIEPIAKKVKISSYDWLIFTSANGVVEFFRHFFAQHRDIRALDSAKIAAIGPATAEKLWELGLAVDVLPREFVAEALVKAMAREKLEGKRVLIARAAEARDVLPQGLRKLGARVEVFPIYRTVPEKNSAKLAIDWREIDWVTFASSSAAENFAKIFGTKRVLRANPRLKFASIGPITTATAEKFGFRVTVEAKKYTIDGLVKAICEAK